MQRFTRVQKYAHRALAILMFVLIATAAALYIPDISAVVGNRDLVKTIHSYAGFILPIPLVIAFFFLAFRLDAQELNRFHPSDWAWLKRKHFPVDPQLTYPTREYGKFNAGQKLDGAFTVGSIVVMFATGMVMFFSSLFPDDIRTGATFVHDWLALAIVIVVTGHSYKAFSDAQARVGLRTGTVTPTWAKKNHPEWVLAVAQPEVHPADKNQRDRENESQGDQDPPQ